MVGKWSVGDQSADSLQTTFFYGAACSIFPTFSVAFVHRIEIKYRAAMGGAR